MTREIKEHGIRKNEIINTARNLFFQKGYDATPIQDIIDALGIAKGTLYHYFKSKDDLLDSLVDQIMTEMSLRLQPIAASKKSAIEKINEIFRTGAAYKMKNLDAFVVIVKTLYRDENQILRDRMFQRSIQKNSPVITEIVNQGIKAGVFTTSFPEYMGEVMINLGRSINEAICHTLLHEKTDAKTMSALMIKRMAMYQDMIERILGAPEGSIKIYDGGDFEKIVKHFLDALHKDDDTDNNTKKRYKMW
ncbi:TetR/AcrR family transcriptional regulator [candidate division WOR-3 bacterium]|nr:TetR/AcrR family transcriptional regulator [candidate division WOR-3 bacterium]